jgi:hypothetical protein
MEMSFVASDAVAYRRRNCGCRDCGGCRDDHWPIGEGCKGERPQGALHSLAKGENEVEICHLEQ